MRHQVKGHKLGRTSSHRLATLRALATALFKNKKIKTTLAKADALRIFSEKLITKAKKDDVFARRIVSRDIHDKTVVQELFNEILPKVNDRSGGYTRIIKLGHRLGDAAQMAFIELVDFSEGTSRRTEKSSETEKIKAAAPAKVVEEKKKDKETIASEEVKAEDSVSNDAKADASSEEKAEKE